jgi:hypothetical protein
MNSQKMMEIQGRRKEEEDSDKGSAEGTVFRPSC